jgi:hypothetical protein
MGHAALNCCRTPPGQSSKSVAPISGSRNSICQRAPVQPAHQLIRERGGESGAACTRLRKRRGVCGDAAAVGATTEEEVPGGYRACRACSGAKRVRLTDRQHEGSPTRLASQVCTSLTCAPDSASRGGAGVGVDVSVEGGGGGHMDTDTQRRWAHVEQRLAVTHSSHQRVARLLYRLLRTLDTPHPTPHPLAVRQSSCGHPQ